MLTHRTAEVTRAAAHLSRRLAGELRTVSVAIARDVVRRTGLGKASAEEEDERDAARAIDAADWAPIARAAATEFEAVARDGAHRTLLTLGVSDDESITSQTFDEAVEAARARAAELVGKSWDEDGELIDNPDADMAITETLREEIRGAVAEALEAGDSASELSGRIEELAGFSAARAEMVARTEIIRSHAQGQLSALRESGVVDKKGWSVSGEATVCDDCQANEDEGAIDLDDDFPNGGDPVDAPPGHPLCECVLVAVIEEPDEGDDEESDNDNEEDDEETE